MELQDILALMNHVRPKQTVQSGPIPSAARISFFSAATLDFMSNVDASLTNSWFMRL